MYSKPGLDEEAAQLFEQTFEARRRVLGDGHPDTLDSKLGLAKIHDSKKFRPEQKKRADSFFPSDTFPLLNFLRRRYESAGLELGTDQVLLNPLSTFFCISTSTYDT